ncbi:MAG: DUF1617 family protein [Peptostreptococcaceae bacterium]|uniref:DUF1617 family protein n=1 Tax=Clostridium sp. TaxID=1506 RepID=UPI0030287314
MKLTNRRIVENTSFLANLSNTQLPIRVSYAIAKNISKIEKELKIYNSERQKLLDKYCIKDDDGKNKIDEDNQLKIADENLEDWNKEINELLDIEVDIDIHKFNVDDLLNSNCLLAANELMLIDYMIED